MTFTAKGAKVAEEETTVQGFAEGPGVLLDVKTAKDADTVKKLAGIKLEN